MAGVYEVPTPCTVADEPDIKGMRKGHRLHCPSGRALTSGGEIMPFEVGDVYECTTGQTAIVIQIRSDGREGLLRVNGKAEEWVLWDELAADGQWQLRRDTPSPTLFPGRGH